MLLSFPHGNESISMIYHFFSTKGPIGWERIMKNMQESKKKINYHYSKYDVLPHIFVVKTYLLQKKISLHNCYNKFMTN